MNPERVEMEVKEIILKNCREMKPLNLKIRDPEDEMFSPSRYSFDELQFDIMSVQLVEYINRNKGDERKTKAN